MPKAAPTQAENLASAVETRPEEELLPGLDAKHQKFLAELLQKPSWTRSELKAAAAKMQIMLDGALEHINEAAFDLIGEPLTEGDDPVTGGNAPRETSGTTLVLSMSPLAILHQARTLKVQWVIRLGRFRSSRSLLRFLAGESSVDIALYCSTNLLDDNFVTQSDHGGKLEYIPKKGEANKLRSDQWGHMCATLRHSEPIKGWLYLLRIDSYHIVSALRMGYRKPQ